MKRSIDDQIKAGIDYITYGQLQDMQAMFLDPLIKEKIGFSKIDGDFWVIDELDDLKNPVTLELLDFLKENIKEKKLKIAGTKVQITGTITLASLTKVSKEHNALEYSDILLNYSDVVKKIAKFYDKAGVDIISIDEPSLSYALWIAKERDELIECINNQFSEIKKAARGIHVCGDISGFSDLLLETDADYLDHEFVVHPNNLEEYKKDELEKYDKMIGLGSVRTAIDPLHLVDVKEEKKPISKVIETKDEIKKHILRGGKQFGLENLIIDPDCGFGGIKQYLNQDGAEKIAYHKMKNMSDATKEIKKEKL